MPGHALFVSPHLDDVAFSCAGFLIRLIDAGWQVTLVTVFTASRANPTGFALACQTDKGFGPEVDYMALRRAEDHEFARRAGNPRVVHLDHLEAPHRGYASAPELFTGVRDGDEVWRAIREDLARIARECPATLVVVPLGIGHHVDHLQVVRALEPLRLAAAQVVDYPELPYAGRLTSPIENLTAIGIDRVSTRALDAIAAYASQLDFQFGGEPAMRRWREHYCRGSSGGGRHPATERLRFAPGIDPEALVGAAGSVR